MVERWYRPTLGLDRATRHVNQDSRLDEGAGTRDCEAISRDDLLDLAVDLR